LAIGHISKSNSKLPMRAILVETRYLNHDPDADS
jgi:hypothetical protein